MMQNVLIGQYIHGTSPIHRMDPRSKLIAIFIFVLIVFLANNWVSYGLLGVFTVGAAALSQVPFRYLLKGLKPIIWIILFTMLIHMFTTKEGPVILDLGWTAIHRGGLVRGGFIALRLFYLIVVTSLLTLTTPPMDITDGLESILSPLKRCKFPVHEFALMMSIALRFIPTLIQETEKIMKAQSARGAEFSSGPLKERLKAFVPLLVPLFVSAFKRAEDLALAMEARGYRGGEGRTKLRLLGWKFRDTACLLSVVLLIIALFLFRS